MTKAQYDRITAAPFTAASWAGLDMTKAQYDGIVAAIGAAGVAIGAAVGGGTAGRVLFEGAGPVLADDASLTHTTANGLKVIIGTVQVTLGKGVNALQAMDGVHTVAVCNGTDAVSYLAGNAAKWAAGVPPTDVWIALDRCAAALTVLTQSP